jgi:hypothetical protein
MAIADFFFFGRHLKAGLDSFGLRFDPNLRYGADLNMWIRALSHGRGFISRRLTVIYDRDSGQLMNNARQSMFGMPDYFKGTHSAGFGFSAKILAGLFGIKQAFFIGLGTNVASLEIPDSFQFMRRVGLGAAVRAAFYAGRLIGR